MPCSFRPPGAAQSGFLETNHPDDRNSDDDTPATLTEHEVIAHDLSCHP